MGHSNILFAAIISLGFVSSSPLAAEIDLGLILEVNSASSPSENEVIRPRPRPTSVATVGQDEPFVDMPLDERLLAKIGTDLKNLESEMAIEELNFMARYALEIERPDLFRLVMVSEVDAHWSGLSDARTALNMIAWLPDTAEYLPPRITAARLAISHDELPEIEAARLWRDLRARVERVGDPGLLIELADAMIRSSSTDMLIDTITRFHGSRRQRLVSLVELLQSHGSTAPVEVSNLLYEAISETMSEDDGPAFHARHIAKAYWSIGRHQEALAVLESEPDALLRLRTRFELLGDLPAVVVEGEGNGPSHPEPAELDINPIEDEEIDISDPQKDVAD